VLRQAMLNSGFSNGEDFVGCSDDEILQVIRKASPFNLPDEYLAFLRIMGRKSRPLFAGSGVNFPSSLYIASDAADDVASGPGETLTLENRFFFGHHQGYIVYFFEKNSPAVFGYKEGDPRVHRLADNFIDWMWIEWEDTRESLIEIEETRARTEAKRAQLRAEGKIDW
jgi:hypothetical protein